MITNLHDICILQCNRPFGCVCMTCEGEGSHLVFSPVGVSWSLCLCNTDAVYGVHISNTCSILVMLQLLLSHFLRMCFATDINGWDCDADIIDTPSHVPLVLALCLCKKSCRSCWAGGRNIVSSQWQPRGDLLSCVNKLSPKGAPAKCNTFNFSRVGEQISWLLLLWRKGRCQE